MAELGAFIRTCLEAKSESELFDDLRAFAARYGANLVSYHLVLKHLHKIDFEDGFFYHCFPKEWVARYEAQKYFEIDPIIAACIADGEPFHWYEVGRRVHLTPAQKAYLEDLRAHGIVDGLAIPIYSKGGTAAYFGIGSSEHPLRLGDGEVMELVCACHQVHYQFLELRGADPAPSAALSRREGEVLSWIARGKSNASVATILGISEGTVDTLVRRAFQKLGVTDRISAVLKAVGMGVIHV